MKAKTKKAATKRFRKTSRGKVMRMRQMAGHLKKNKSRTAKDRYKSAAVVSKPEKKNIARLMPYN